MVNKMQQQVADFHRAMGQPVGHSVRALPQERKAVRIELIREEFLDELIPALEADDLVEMGVDAEIIFNEVQRSNMSKFGADGKPIIAGPNDPDGVFEGRVKKGPNYFKPDIGGLLASGHADLDIAAATAVH
jgi:predicted HAD superfamily Cof-like phosphohydrolase